MIDVSIAARFQPSPAPQLSRSEAREASIAFARMLAVMFWLFALHAIVLTLKKSLHSLIVAWALAGALAGLNIGFAAVYWVMA